MGEGDKKKAVGHPTGSSQMQKIPIPRTRGLVTHINPDPLPPVLNPVQGSTPDRHGRK